MSSWMREGEIEYMRTPHESNTEWKIRRKFLDKYYGKMDQDRLIPLSQCYVNVEMWGCMYPPEVMRELSYLTRDFERKDTSDPTNLPSRLKGRETVKFVRGDSEVEGNHNSEQHHTSGEKNSRMNSPPPSKKPALDQDSINSSRPTPPRTMIVKKVVPVTGMKFVKASGEFKSTDFSNFYPESISQETACKVSVQSGRSKGMGLGYSTSSKYDIACVNDVDQRFRTLSTAVKDLKKKFGEGKNGIEIMQMAVDKIKMGMETKFRDVVGLQFAHTFVCTVTVDGLEVVEATATNKKSAKHSAFDIIVNKLMCTHVYVDQSNPDKPELIGTNEKPNTVKLEQEKEDNSITSTTKNASNSALVPSEVVTSQNTSNATQSASNTTTCTSSVTSEHSSSVYESSPKNTYSSPCRITFNIPAFSTSDDSGCTTDIVDESGTPYDLYDNVGYDNSYVWDNALYESNSKVIYGSQKNYSGNSINGDISMFIIFERIGDENQALNVLSSSCAINKALLEFYFVPDSSGVNMRCRIDLEGQTIVEATGVGKVNAKNLAALRAVEELRKICWTIKIKQNVDCPVDSCVSKDEVMGDIEKQVQSIANDNIGNKLLRKMGWNGGGVGAEGNKGREEPVACSLQQIVKREGLGLNSDNGVKDFRKNIREVVENYAKSESQQDLTFTSDFTKDERAYIHTIGQKLGLKTQSRGKGENRYLTLSRKRTKNQLFDHLMREGGSTHKYELIPPENGEY